MNQSVFQSLKLLSLVMNFLYLCMFLWITPIITTQLEILDLSSFIFTPAEIKPLVYFLMSLVVLSFILQAYQMKFIRTKMVVSYNDERIMLEVNGKNDELLWKNIKSISGAYIKLSPFYAEHVWVFSTADSELMIQTDVDDASEQLKLLDKIDKLEGFNWEQYHSFYKHSGKLILNTEIKHQMWQRT